MLLLIKPGILILDFIVPVTSGLHGKITDYHELEFCRPASVLSFIYLTLDRPYPYHLNPSVCD